MTRPALWKDDSPLRLLEYAFAARGVISKAGMGPATHVDPYPDWMEELDDATKAVLYQPGYQSSSPPPALVPNGKKTEVADHRDGVHPSIYERDPGVDIDYKEFYYWDLCGHLVIRNIMTKEELELANEAIDKFADQIVREKELSRGSKSLSGTGRPLLKRLLELPKPYCEPFRRMVAHPEIVRRLTWLPQLDQLGGPRSAPRACPHKPLRRAAEPTALTPQH